MRTDVLIIGAGASGLVCAMEAGKRGRSVSVLDHSATIGRKIQISGGGKCNFTNRVVSSDHYLSRNPHFTTSALSRFTPDDFIALVEKHRIPYHERSGGQLFCNGGSQEIVQMLTAECSRASVSFVLNCNVSEVLKNEGFRVSTNHGVFECDSLVIATGGLAAPQLGATNFGHALARRFGMDVTPLRPALTPLRLAPREAEVFAPLSGISLDAIVSHQGTRFREKVLFTHRGLSGPAILQISSYWRQNDFIELDLLPDEDALALLEKNRRSRMLLSTLLGRHLPTRFARAWCDLLFEPKPLNQCTPKDLQVIAHGLHHWKLQPLGVEGFNKAEVTLGGVDTAQLSSRTMESRRVGGLYFLGEVLDVTGHLGGYNLHWAWASGYAAGRHV